jgi:adenosylhomocysteine nucleosidase
MTITITRNRLATVAMLAAVAALVWALLASSSSTAGAAGAKRIAPVGILNAFSVEQAPILAEMHVTGSRTIDGFKFWEGTIGGYPVVDALSGEINESAELASYILDKTFHPRAMIYSGTAGAQDNAVHVGDVVLSGFVEDKSAIHYFVGGDQQPYGAVEVLTTKHSDLRGAITSYSEVTPATPRDAKNYGYGPTTPDKQIKMVSAFAAPKELVTLGLKASGRLGSDTLDDATGGTITKGSVKNKAIAGVIGTADVWTEPLSWIEAQNALYPTDAEENEGPGFAFANAQLGVPWILVRGISDSVWYPNAYNGPLASQRAAFVTKYIVEHLPKTISLAPETLADLSATSNARKYGYLVASEAYYGVTPVTKIVVGKRTLSAAQLLKLNAEYSYTAGGL